MSTTSYTCGQTLPTGCSLYTAKVPTFIDEKSLPCNLFLDDVLDASFDKIKLLFDSNDFTELQKNCLDFDPSTVTAKGLHQIEIDKICEHESEITALQNLDIGAKTINIDMGCLESQASPCSQGNDIYTLLSILTVFKNEICTIKQYLNL